MSATFINGTEHATSDRSNRLSEFAVAANAAELLQAPPWQSALTINKNGDDQESRNCKGRISYPSALFRRQSIEPRQFVTQIPCGNLKSGGETYRNNGEPDTRITSHLQMPSAFVEDVRGRGRELKGPATWLACTVTFVAIAIPP
jgi:hypothetical protein